MLCEGLSNRGMILPRKAVKGEVMSRGSTTMALLGLLVSFIDVDGLRMIPIPGVGIGICSTSRWATSAIRKRDPSSAWHSGHRRLLMSSLSALDDFTTEEVDGATPQMTVMDEIDAILGEASVVEVRLVFLLDFLKHEPVTCSRVRFKILYNLLS